MTVTLTRTTDARQWTRYDIHKAGEHIGQLFTHPRVGHWHLKLRDDLDARFPKSRFGSTYYPGMAPCPTFREAKTWVLANL